jgi:hypothetical protein
VTVAQAGAGGRLEVQALAKGASLAKAKAKSKASGVVVGRFVRGSVRTGKVSFKISLNSSAKRALHRHHKLALTVKVTLTPPGGKAQTMTRSVVVHG